MKHMQKRKLHKDLKQKLVSFARKLSSKVGDHLLGLLIALIIGSTFVGAIWSILKKGFHNTLLICINILSSTVIQMQLTIKLYLLLILLSLLVTLIFLLYKQIKKTINKRYISLDNINLEQTGNFKFYWYKDINSNNVIIDKIPYCAIHNKKLVEVQDHDYICLEPGCNNGIVYVQIDRLIKSVSDNIIEKAKKLRPKQVIRKTGKEPRYIF